MHITFAEDLGLTCRLFISFMILGKTLVRRPPAGPVSALLHNALRLIPRKYLLHAHRSSKTLGPRGVNYSGSAPSVIAARTHRWPLHVRQAVFGQMIEDCCDASATSEPTIIIAPAVDVFLALSHSLRGFMCVYIDEIIIELWAPCCDALLGLYIYVVAVLGYRRGWKPSLTLINHLRFAT